MASDRAIGTLREGPLHAAIKEWYREPGDRVEAEVDGFVVDLVRGRELIEVQTGHFSCLRPKLAALLDRHPVRVVHPVAAERWLVRLDPAGAVVSRRRSPARGSVLGVFRELVSIPDVLSHPNFTLEVLLTCEEEVRREAPRRRAAARTCDRTLLEVRDRVVLRDVGDAAALIPRTLGDPFTTADVAVALAVRRPLAQKVVYCLRRMGVIAVVGRARQAPLYARA